MLNLSYLGRIKDIKPASTLPPTMLQQFMDDTFFFGISSVVEAREWRSLLDHYTVASGQCIKYHRSVVFLFNMDLDIQLIFLDILGCQPSSLPSTYLGLPLIVKKIRTNFWNSILERTQKKLQGGKVISLVVLWSFSYFLPPSGFLVYFFSLFKILGAMADKLDKI